MDMSKFNLINFIFFANKEYGGRSFRTYPRITT